MRASKVRWLEKPAAEKSLPVEGLKCKAEWKSGTVYDAEIVKDNGDGTYHLRYDDGDEWKSCPESKIKWPDERLASNNAGIKKELLASIKKVREEAVKASNGVKEAKEERDEKEPRRKTIKECISIIDRVFKENPGADQELLRLLAKNFSTNNMDLMEPTAFDPTGAKIQRYPILFSACRGCTAIAQVRLFMLREVNKLAFRLLNVIDIEETSLPGPLFQMIQQVSSLLYLPQKYEWITSKLTKSSRCETIEVDQLKKAALDLEPDSRDDDLTATIFGQLFQKEHDINFQVDPADGSARGYKVDLKGMSSVDLGGPYRQTIANMCEELQSPKLNLLCKSPNHNNGLNKYPKLWLPNPGATSETERRALKFLGKLMGMAFRSTMVLPIDLPSCFWRKFLQQDLTVYDLEEIDASWLKFYTMLRKLRSNGDRKEFDRALNNDLQSLGKFQYKSLSGENLELMEGGHHMDLDWDNCELFLRLFRDAREREIAVPASIIRGGFTEVIPSKFLQFLCKEDLEEKVSGRSDIDIREWKRLTEYRDGFSADSPEIKWFWKMIEEELDPSLVVKFGYGTSRLPVTGNWGSERCKIGRYTGSGSDAPTPLPHAQSCFFEFKLPKYDSYDQMLQAFKIALCSVNAIDGD
eukprot:CAMPEP_0114519404 /NCGR_PEP_ID=MMETSP0109-20121206/18986_1 /TAXON_ID=29199 /ORGANISM="Chlorarachnion reptans, Strain CCCM449" /LENGTH=638 /DNA_ID=CAMNT_0001700143 /DNA_START=166 /DNA_END=2083 /DNA_ORIENTATION=+